MEVDLPVCSFGEFSSKNCDHATFVDLVSCTGSLSSHLRFCKVPQRFENILEYELILARVGLFESMSETWRSSTICKSHRHEFGLGFTPKRKCLYPEHPRTSKAKPERGVDFLMSKWIFDNYQQLVPVGAGKLN